jgi:energy-coupling factor transporter ATP-binding protein EcfA2
MGLWDAIKRIFSRKKKDLCITVFGPSGAGKTSLLACMSQAFTNQAIAGFLVSEPETFNTLKLAYNELEKMGNGQMSTIRVPSLVQGTENLRQHIFTLNGVKVKFFDFPGAWMNSNVSGSESEHYKTVLDIVKKSMVILVAIDTPYLMEARGKYMERAKVSDTEHFLQWSLNNVGDSSLVMPKLILLVPIKCEKYTRSAEDTQKMLQVVKETFKQTVNMVTKNHFDRLALAVLPIHTIGNVEFSHFDREKNDEMVFTRNKQPFTSRDADQPLRYAVSFLLKQQGGAEKGYWKRRDLRKITEIVQEGIKVKKENGFEIISGREMLGL